MKVENGKVVTIRYRLVVDGEVADEGELSYLHGHGQLIPGLEEALEGHEKGDVVKVTLPPEKAYGQPDPEGVQVVDRSAFPEGSRIEVGEQYLAQDASGAQMPFTITKVEGDQVTIDFNHPLAGKTLEFEVEILEVRDATPEELAHGHAHGPGGHHH